MEKSELLEKINQTALDICHLMSDQDRNSFFDYQEERIEKGVNCKKKYYSGRNYYKGKRKGQLKEVFEVDGCGFEKLWKLLNAFASKSVYNFFRTRKMFNYDGEDELEDIKYQTFYVLRFFGPTPNSVSFSSIFPMICKNVLSNASRRMFGVKSKTYSYEEGAALLEEGRVLIYDQENNTYLSKASPSYKTIINFKTVSLYNNIMVEETEGDNVTICDTLNTGRDEVAEMEFWASIPSDIKDIVEKAINGESISAIAKEAGKNRHFIENTLKTIALDFYKS